MARAINVFALPVALLLTACVATPPVTPDLPEKPLVTSDEANVPLVPGHVVQPCPFPAERTVCVRVPGEASRNDEAGDERLAADYAKRFEADGWRLTQEGPRPVLAKAPRCVRLEALLSDDGKSARMRYERILRVEFDPEGVACSG